MDSVLSGPASAGEAVSANDIAEAPPTFLTTRVANAAELKAALLGAKGGETIVLAGGTYGPVSVSNLNPVSKVTIMSADGSNPAVLTGLSILSSSNITVRNVDMFDKDAATSFDFLVRGSKNVTFDHITMHGDQIESIPFIIRNSTNVSVTNSEFYNLRMAINHLDNNGLTLDNNYFHDLRADGIRGGGSSNVKITNNFFTNFYIAPDWSDHADAIQFWTTNETASAENITITGNAIVRGAGGAIQGIFMNDEVGTLPYKNVVIDNNLAVGTTYHGILVANGVNVSVTNNTVTGFADQKSWIKVAAGAVLMQNMAQHYIVDQTTITLSNNDIMAGPPSDGGLNILKGWLNDNPALIGLYDAVQTALDRGPTTAEILMAATGALASPDGEVRAVVYAQAHFKAIIDEHIASLYYEFGGRSPNAAELDYWRAQIANGAGYESVRGAILSDPLGQGHTRVLVDSFYVEYMGRNAIAPELDYWHGRMEAGIGFQEVRSTIVHDPTSIEHLRSVTTGLYQEYFGRFPNEEELHVWIDLYARGATIERLVDALMLDSGSANTVERLAGTSGEDRFYLGVEIGHVVISQFDAKVDKIDLSASGLSFGSSGSVTQATADDVLLVFSPQDTILLQNTQLAQLSSVNFA